MRRNSQRLADRLRHIIEAIGRIDRYVCEMDEVAFLKAEMVQDAVIRNLEIIDEACHVIERDHPAFAAAHPELPLAAAYQMRNATARSYFKVDMEIVWRTIRSDLVDLHLHVLHALDLSMHPREEG